MWSTWTYTSASGNNLTSPVVHTSGTIFTIDGSSVVGINPATGGTFSVQMENSTFTENGNCTNPCTSPLPPPSLYSYTNPPLIGSLIIAGDGYAYVPYSYTISNGSSANSGCGCGCQGSSASTQYLNLLRVGPTGDSAEISLGQFSSAEAGCSCNWGGCGGGGGGGYSASATLPILMTNADQGVLASYSAGYSNSSTSSYYLATTSGASLASNSQVTMVPEHTYPVQPVLQRADGSYVGTVSSTVGNFMIAFTPGGGTLFTVPNDTPQIATSDNGVIGASGTTYDQNGNVTGQIASVPTQSWLGTQYKIGSVDQLASSPFYVAASYWAFQAGNASGTGTAAVNYEPPQLGLQTVANTNLTTPAACNQVLNNLTQIAISNGRSPGGKGFTKATLLDEIQSTASGATNFVYDGPSSTTLWEQCTTPGCVAMFPVWFTGFQEPPGYQVKQLFQQYDTNPYLEGLSQYNGYAIWLRVISDWSGAWRGLTSQYIQTFSLSKGGQVNSYGLGTLLHEVLHKNSVGGGFTHENLAQALNIGACQDNGEEHNTCSQAIANSCFPNN